MGMGIYGSNGQGSYGKVIVYGRYAKKKKTLIFRGVPFLVIA